MPLSAAERQKRYRDRLKLNNPQKWKALQEKNLERAKKFYKKIGELSDREKESRRKYWRTLKQKSDYKQEVIEKGKTRKEYQRIYQKRYRTLTKENKNMKKKIELLIKENKALKKKIYRYKILQNTKEDEEKENMFSRESFYTVSSPISKTNSFVANLNTTEEEKEIIKKELFEKNVLIESLKIQYNAAGSNEKRNVLKEIVSNDIVKGYKMKSKLQSAIGIKYPIRRNAKKVNIKRNNLANKIYTFFNQDDVSRATAAKKETKTKNKVKMQRRYLLDSMVNLRLKFVKETGIPISYATFRRFKPFYVLIPNLSNRNTCLCKRHSNIDFKFTSLKTLKIFKDGDTLDTVIKSTVCDLYSQKCMYSTCDICKNKSIRYDLLNIKLNEKVSWLEWTVKTIEYEKNNEKKSTKKTIKQIISGMLESLLSNFDTELRGFKIHIYNISHQYKIYKSLKENLQRNEIMLHCDFSENYNCKFHNEIQAVHFGASHSQITLHTSIIYNDETDPESFCTFSNCNKHTPESIWAHLEPLMRDIKHRFPLKDTIHFFSDGPSSQYRQKKNFALLTKMIESYGFIFATWNFFEAAHGKGAADGVGGVVKRLLDKQISYGHDIPDAETAIQLLEHNTATTVKLFLIDQEDILRIENQIEGCKFVAVPNTQKIHQVIPNEDNIIQYRILSCFCLKPNICQCYAIKSHKLITDHVKRSRAKRLVIESTSESESEQEDLEMLVTNKVLPNSDDVEPIGETNHYHVSNASTSNVTILSDIKVNFKPKDLAKMVKKPSKYYNVSTVDLKRNFWDLFSSDSE